MSYVNSTKMIAAMRDSGDKVIRDYAASEAMSDANLLDFAFAAIGTDCIATRESLLDLIGVSEVEVLSAIEPFKATVNYDLVHIKCREIAQTVVRNAGSASYLH